MTESCCIDATGQMQGTYHGSANYMFFNKKIPFCCNNCVYTGSCMIWLQIGSILYFSRLSLRLAGKIIQAGNRLFWAVQRGILEGCSQRNWDIWIDGCLGSCRSWRWDERHWFNLGIQTQTFSLQDSKEEVQRTILCSSWSTVQRYWLFWNLCTSRTVDYGLIDANSWNPITVEVKTR